MAQNENKVTGNMMSNAKLKEQIEAAKIALVHSAEVGAYDETPPTSGTVTQVPSIETNPAKSHVDRVTTMPKSPANAEATIIGQDTIPQSDLETLEARLEDLEDQIKNQQRDLHTLLQKLRDITAKSQAATEPEKSKGTKRLFMAVALCVMAFSTIYYWLGAEVIVANIYQATGLIVALIDTLAGKI